MAYSGDSIWKFVKADFKIAVKNVMQGPKSVKQLLWCVTLIGILVLVVTSYVVYCDSAVMPDLVGESFSDARHMLKESGFVNFSLASEDGNEEGTVAEQDFAAGTVLCKTDQSFLVVMEVQEPIYEIYLFSEYKLLYVMKDTEITATVNFEANEISITAYLNGTQNGDTVQLSQADAETWKVKVHFEEAGIYEVVATAIAADGSQIEKAIEIQVITW